MEIVKLGNVQYIENWKLNKECPQCKAVICGNIDDLKKYHWFGTHFKHNYLAFDCICCGKIIPLKETEDVPKPIYDKYSKHLKSKFDGQDDSIY